MAVNADQYGIPYNLIGARIFRIRTNQGLTQRQLAKRLKVTPPVVNKIESGMHCPQLVTLWRIAKVLKVQMRMLIPEDW